MAQFAIGQRVAFKDDARKGTVVSVLNDGRLLVHCIDGMDFPAHATELVALGKKPAPALPQLQPLVENQPSPIIHRPKPTQQEGVKLSKPSIVFLAESDEQPENSDLAILAINPTNWFIKLHFFVDDDNGLMRLQASIEIKPNSNETLLKVRRSQIGSLGNMRAEAMFYSEFAFKPQAPVALDIKSNPKRFLKPGSYTQLRGYGFGFIHTLENEVHKVVPQVAVAPTRAQTTPKTKVRHIEEEIDLHIEKFDPAVQHLDSHSIVLRQLAHCQKHLNRALAEGHLSIVFIHGIGTGRLKAEVLSLIHAHQLQAQPIPHNPGAMRVILKWG